MISSVENLAMVYRSVIIIPIKLWLRMAKLDLAEEKTEAAVIINCWKNNVVNNRVCNHVVNELHNLVENVLPVNR